MLPQGRDHCPGFPGRRLPGKPSPPAGVNARGRLRRCARGRAGFLPERAGGSALRGLRAGSSDGPRSPTPRSPPQLEAAPVQRFIPPRPLPAAARERSWDGDHQQRAWPRSLPSLRLSSFFFYWSYSRNIKVCLWDPAIVRPPSCTAREMFYCFPRFPDEPQGPAPAASALCSSRRGRAARRPPAPRPPGRTHGLLPPAPAPPASLGCQTRPPDPAFGVGRAVGGC